MKKKQRFTSIPTFLKHILPYEIFTSKLNYLNFSESYLIRMTVIVGIPDLKLPNAYNFMKQKAFFV